MSEQAKDRSHIMKYMFTVFSEIIHVNQRPGPLYVGASYMLTDIPKVPSKVLRENEENIMHFLGVPLIQSSGQKKKG